MTTLLAIMGAAGVVLLAFGVPAIGKPRLPRRVEPYLSGLHGRPSALLERPRLSRGAPAGWIAALVPRFFPGPEHAIEQRLAAAGDRRGVDAFRMEQLLWGILGAVAAWGLVFTGAFAGTTVDLRVVPVLTAIGFTFGFLARDWRLSREIEGRLAILREELPTAMDLVALAIMSGESVPAAFARVAPMLGAEMGRELEGVVAEVRGGRGVVESLEGLAQRVPLAGVARFCDALCTAIERGTPLAEVLRAQADDSREARRRYLLETGGRREVLMLVPVVFLVMPVVVLFVLYPGLVSLDLLVP